MRIPSYIRHLGLIDLFYLSPDQVQIEDVASTLAKINRYGGRTPYPYSVAQHAVAVSYLCPQALAYEGLHHDDTEAFLGDVIGPVKAWLPWFKWVEDNRIRPAVAKSLGLAVVEPPAVKAADKDALVLEQWYIQGWIEKASEATRKLGPSVPSLPDLFGPLDWREARDRFLARHERLRPRAPERRVGL